MEKTPKESSTRRKKPKYKGRKTPKKSKRCPWKDVKKRSRKSSAIRKASRKASRSFRKLSQVSIQETIPKMNYYRSNHLINFVGQTNEIENRIIVITNALINVYPLSTHFSGSHHYTTFDGLYAEDENRWRITSLHKLWWILEQGNYRRRPILQAGLSDYARCRPKRSPIIQHHVVTVLDMHSHDRSFMWVML